MAGNMKIVIVIIILLVLSSSAGVAIWGATSNWWGLGGEEESSPSGPLGTTGTPGAPRGPSGAPVPAPSPLGAPAGTPSGTPGGVVVGFNNNIKGKTFRNGPDWIRVNQNNTFTITYNGLLVNFDVSYTNGSNEVQFQQGTSAHKITYQNDTTLLYSNTISGSWSEFTSFTA